MRIGGKNMKKNLLPVFAAVLLLCLLAGIGAAAAEIETGDITSHCSITVNNHDAAQRLTGPDYSICWKGDPGSVITVRVFSGRRAQGVCVSFFGTPAALTAQDTDGNVIGVCDSPFENAYIAFSHPVEAFTLTNTDEDTASISRLRVIEEGELPRWVQQWQTLDDKADLMLIATHPDDDLLWFGGMLPTYAGVQGKKVIVLYIAGGTMLYRRNELLDGLWTCGVRWYPEIGNFPVTSASSYDNVVQLWGEGAAEKRIVGMIRKYRPDVVLTQDINGEYGHFHHIVAVEAAIRAVTELAGDPAYDPETAAEYGTWAPFKLYLHLYPENQIIFDWRQPLEAFNGETALQVAQNAYSKHFSQQEIIPYKVSDYGKYNCSLFGLYYSAVGEDEAHEDLFENIDCSEE